MLGYNNMSHENVERIRTCMIRPDVTMGEIPSSMRVPLFEAMMTRSQ